MAEWSNAHDSKSCYGQLYGGSNPSLCATKKKRDFFSFLILLLLISVRNPEVRASVATL